MRLHGELRAGVRHPADVRFASRWYFYQFTYEPSPGYAGDTTGRLASITLPGGGTIGHQYTGGYNGFSLDGCVGEGFYGTAGIIRTTSDGPTTYSRSVTMHDQIPFETIETQVQDGQGNQTLVDFVEDGFGSFRETKRRIYQGAASGGNLLLTTMRCYNGDTGDCTAQPISAVTQDVSEIDVTSTPAGSPASSETKTFYNAKSLETEFDEYDYGGSAPSRSTMITYAVLGNNIQNRPQQVMICPPPLPDSAQLISSFLCVRFWGLGRSVMLARVYPAQSIVNT